MAPLGGEPRRAHDDSQEQILATERFFQSGEATLEVIGAHVSGDLAVLALIERQHGEMGDLPDQDWSLRVTLVFRRDDGE